MRYKLANGKRETKSGKLKLDCDFYNGGRLKKAALIADLKIFTPVDVVFGFFRVKSIYVSG